MSGKAGPAPHPAPHLALGAAGEEAALQSLLGKGVRLLARNWRPSGVERGLELDIVLVEGDTVVFVEVKTRRTATVGESRPVHGAFTAGKRTNMIRAARRFLAEHELWSSPCRFDLVCVGMDADNRATLEHYNNVVELGQTLDCRDSPWQPW
jgi:putative endonuclease